MEKKNAIIKIHFCLPILVSAGPRRLISAGILRAQSKKNILKSSPVFSRSIMTNHLKPLFNLHKREAWRRRLKIFWLRNFNCRNALRKPFFKKSGLAKMNPLENVQAKIESGSFAYFSTTHLKSRVFLKKGFRKAF